MFALEVTQYPELEQTAKELGLLDKLYSLYTEAVSTIDNFADILWTEVVANIEQMNEDVGKLQMRCNVILAGKELGEIMEALEESQMVLGGMASNRYSAPFREEVTTWIKNLSTCSLTCSDVVGSASTAAACKAHRG